LALKRRRFPRWRIPNGLAQAPADEVRSSIDASEGAAKWSVWAIIVGLLVEFILTWFHPSYDSIWERWGSAVADALIALGVYCELLFSTMASRRREELQRRTDEKLSEARLTIAALEQKAAAANERTAEIMRAASWRELTLDQKLQLALYLGTAQQPGRVQIAWIKDDLESQFFARQIAEILESAGWTVSRFARTYAGLVWGIRIPGGQGAADRLRAAFNHVGIPFTTESSAGATEAVGSHHAPIAGTAEILVGSRRPEFTQAP
jgi:hypothetical protein